MKVYQVETTNNLYYFFTQKTKIENGLWQNQMLTSIEKCQIMHIENTKDPNYNFKSLIKTYLINKNLIQPTEKVNITKIELITRNYRKNHTGYIDSES